MATDVELEEGLILLPVESIGRSAPWFREAMGQNGGSIRTGTRIATALDRLDSLRDLALSGRRYKFPELPTAYDFFADAFGADFLTKVLHAGCASGLTLPAERWRYLLSGDPILTRRAPSSTERNRTWETVLAALAATFATDVTFDEPDVRCTYAGQHFTLAAKMAYSRENLLDNLKKGFEQAKGRGDASLVFVNAVALYPHANTPEEMTLRWSHARRFQHSLEQRDVILGSVHRWVENNFHLVGYRRGLKPKVEQPIGVAFFVPMLLHYLEQPFSYLYTHMPLTWNGPDGPDYAFATAFLQACNTVRGFLEDAPQAG